jgi:DNA-binding transcriptional LysR family regulator
MLDLVDLHAFIRIAELGSISAAARATNTSKSALSRSLTRLEEHLGTTLLERTTRSLKPTDAGVLLRERGQQLLDQAAQVESAVEALAGALSGELHVTVPYTLATGPIAAMMPAFLTRYPGIRVIFDFDNRGPEVMPEGFDVAIRAGPLPDSDLLARRLAGPALWACASPAYLERHPPITCLADLDAHDWVVHAAHRREYVFRSRDGAERAEHKVVLPAGTVASEPEVVRSMLLSGVGIGLLPDYLAADAVRLGQLVRILPAYDLGTIDITALYPRWHAGSAKVRVFINALTEHLLAARAR